MPERAVKGIVLKTVLKNDLLANYVGMDLGAYGRLVYNGSFNVYQHVKLEPLPG